eukprot:TRINITY_DN73681_c0_g1_i1.p1 TRINITY_DN73681_c0_g1~~TRINITY_DN73681_c0_g1_i1.p1  ORF type:complete len:646 (-),score=98.71 TRINITY_DN73681_c0_g1_i1:383-2320(-)
MAINTCRAVRNTDDFLRIGHGSTELVAPGSYEFKGMQAAPESAVPFESLQERHLNPITTTAKITPGPGSYLSMDILESESRNDRAGSGASLKPFRSKVKRFGPTAPGSTVYTTSTIEKNPGPGTYAIDSTIKVSEHKPEMVAVRPVLEDREKTTPSMPQTRFFPGQEPETEAAKADLASLCCRHTGEPRDMVGPGEYDPRGMDLVMKTEPAVSFHSPRKEKFRSLFDHSVSIDCTMAPHDIPGPGTYDDHVQETASSRGAANKFNSKTPMAYEQTVNQDRNNPGPGAYEQLADLDRNSALIKDRNAALGADRYSFGSMTERVGWHRDVRQPFKDAYNIRYVPGPGHYPDTTTLFKDPKRDDAQKAMPGAQKKKFNGVHHPTIILALQEADGPLSAFNTTDDRPCNKELDQTTPAPDSYSRENARGQSMFAALREKAKVGRKGVFGTCADRFYGSPLAGREGLPDPSFDGGGMNMGAEGAGPDTRSSFKSSSPRVAERAGPKDVEVTKVGSFQTPAPGAYTINKEPNYRSPYRIPRSEHLSFGSGKTRFTEKQDLFTKFQLPVDNPPPGFYRNITQDRVRGAPVLKDKRKPLHSTGTSETVGPGSYDVVSGTTLLKKTHNVTTQAPLSARPSRPVLGSTVSQGSFY